MGDAAALDDPTARGLLWTMQRIRMAEEAVQRLYADQEMRCPTHLSIGQEAIAAGVCAHLTQAEHVLSAHRSHAHYLAKGGDLRAMFAELYGKVTGCSRGKGGSMHLIDLAAGFLAAVPIVGSTIPIAVGAAFGSVQRGDPRVTAVFFGDAAVETGVFHESINFASVHRLPIVMVCENNLYSVLTPLAARQPPREIVDLAAGHAVWAAQGDGNDVKEVWEIAHEAVRRARDGEGPSFLEFKTYRMLEHCGPNDDDLLGYRPPGELDTWRSRDPLVRLQDDLLRRGVVDPTAIDAKRREIEAWIADASRFAQESSFPDADELVRDVWAP
ncbi:MAG: thiamine pyrophosphate-dependent dehydrogenase E1 component subunit alpha [Acidimicrobiales bacterium]